MNAYELASNHKSVFTYDAIGNIAKAANSTPKVVNQLIDEHDSLRGDRRWYQIREQFGRDLPASPEAKEILARRDRPRAQVEKEQQEKQMKHLMNTLKQRKLTTQPTPRRHHRFSRGKTGKEDRWSVFSYRSGGGSPHLKNA